MSEKAQTKTRPSGMGAIPGAKGVTFRVWAPHAEKVYVTGTFNDWSTTAAPWPERRTVTGRLMCRKQTWEMSTAM